MQLPALCKEEVMQHSVALVGRCQTKFHAQNHVFLYFVGSACRNKVVRWVSVNFKTPADADAHYFGPEALVEEEALPSVSAVENRETRSTASQTESEDMARLAQESLRTQATERTLCQSSLLCYCSE